MADIQKLSGVTQDQQPLPDGSVLLKGKGPLSRLMDYPLELAQYTHGEGAMSLQNGVFEPCHNPDQVIEQRAYDAGADVDHPAWSVFCAKGAGYAVNWQDVPDQMHTQVPALRLQQAGVE